MQLSIHVAQDTEPVSVRAAAGVGIVVDFGIGSLQFNADQAFALADQLRDALRALATLESED